MLLCIPLEHSPLLYRHHHTLCTYLLLVAIGVSVALDSHQRRCSEHLCTSVCIETYFLFSWIKTSEQKDKPIFEGGA